MNPPVPSPALSSVNAAINAMIQAIPDGWLSPEKGHAMAALIEQVRPTLCVEIGVYSGRSLFAQALAMRVFGNGLLVGIDPWQRAATIEGGYDETNNAWWSTLDLHKFHTDFMEHLWGFGFQDRCLVIRNGAEAAAELFQPFSIDILHIDGNHSELVSTRDVNRWLSLLKLGGYIWFDDVHWSSTQKAVQMLESACDFVLQADQARLYRVRSEGKDKAAEGKEVQP